MAAIVVEAGAGAARAVTEALRALGEDAAVTADPEVVARAERLVVAGRGPVGEVRRALGGGLDEALRTAAARGAALLAIGAGFAALLDGDRGARGLGLLAGGTAPFGGRDGATPKVPLLGPVEVRVARREGPFVDLATRTPFAFLLAERPVLADPADRAALAAHGGPFDAAALRGNVAAVAFHPEKSGRAGLALLAAFARWRP